MAGCEADLVVVGAGPAGLCAAVEAARLGVETIMVDENSRPGGQLFKQIHKFFGSHRHRAGVRGFRIGEQLLADVEKVGVRLAVVDVVVTDEQGLPVSDLTLDDVLHGGRWTVIAALTAACSGVLFAVRRPAPIAACTCGTRERNKGGEP